VAGFVPKHSVTVCDFPGSTAFAFVKATSHLFGQLTPSPSAVVLVVLFFRSTKSRTGKNEKNETQRRPDLVIGLLGTSCGRRARSATRLAARCCRRRREHDINVQLLNRTGPHQLFTFAATSAATPQLLAS
jgi:hypothetical protein